jgi:hypothetical protein
MFRKLFIVLAPLLAVAAFAVMPVAAQATGHYYQNNVKLAEGAKRTVTGWGTLSLVGVKGGVLPNHITCHYAVGGTVENPLGSGAGVGVTEAFSAYDCEEENICAGTAVRVRAEKPALINNTAELAWPSVLTEPEAGVFRSEMSKVKLDIACMTGPEEVARHAGFVEVGGYGTETPGQLLKPLAHNGTNAAHPGGVIFGTGSGELEEELSGGTITVRIEGELKTLGYSAQELINVKE